MRGSSPRIANTKGFNAMKCPSECGRKFLHLEDLDRHVADRTNLCSEPLNPITVGPIEVCSTLTLFASIPYIVLYRNYKPQELGILCLQEGPPRKRPKEQQQLIPPGVDDRAEIVDQDNWCFTNHLFTLVEGIVGACLIQFSVVFRPALLVLLLRIMAAWFSNKRAKRCR